MANIVEIGTHSLNEDTRSRFASKHVLDGQCWTWIGVRDTPSGYGRFWLDGRMDVAHRVSYLIHVGPIPPGWVVRRTCENTTCVNPAHLEVAAKPRVRQASGRPWANVYNTPEWRKARALALVRDGHRCTVGHIFGGPCSTRLHVHHIVPLEEGGAPYDIENLGTVCARHHPRWEACRRYVMREMADDLQHRVKCPHQHRSPEAREICEARLARQRRSVAA